MKHKISQAELLKIIPLVNDFILGKIDEHNFLNSVLIFTLQTQNSNSGIIE